MRQRSHNDVDDLERLVEQVAERLRDLSDARQRVVEAQVGRLLAALAAVALRAEGEPGHPVPRVGRQALGDQVEVLGRDLVAALRARPSNDLAAQGYDVLVSIRRALP